MTNDIGKMVARCQKIHGLERCFLFPDNKKYCKYAGAEKKVLIYNKYGYPEYQTYYKCNCKKITK